MATVDLVMPKMGENMMEATILKWHKKPGDVVKMDETILEIAADKVDSEVPSKIQGTIEEILYNENDVVPIGSVIARIKTPVEEVETSDKDSSSLAEEQGGALNDASEQKGKEQAKHSVYADVCKTSIDEATLRRLLAEIYYVASKDEKSDMLATAEILEFIRKELLNGFPLTIWGRLSLNRSKFDQPFLTPLLVKLKSDYFERLYQALAKQVHEAYQMDEETGWLLWFQYYVAALVQWKGEIYDRLCREAFPHPSSKEPFILKLKQLNQWILDSRWSDCYGIYFEILQSEEVSVENIVMIEVILGQIQLYYFPDIKDSIKHFEGAKSMLEKSGIPNSARVERAFAEYYLKLAENDIGRSHIFNAMSIDNYDIENYQLMGDSYRDEGNIAVAEQWYNDALNFNFLDAGSYAKFFELINDETYFKGAYSVKENNEKKDNNEKRPAFNIEELINKIAHLEPDSSYTNVLYNAYRSAGYAYSINNKIEQSEKYYRHAIEMHPDWTIAYLDLAYVLGSNKQTEQTERIFMEVMKLDKDSFNLNWNLAWWNGQKGDLDTARDFYLKCISIRPQWSSVVYQSLEDLYRKHNRYEELITFYESEIAKEPKIDYYLRLAYNYEKLKQLDLAEKQYREILKLNEEDDFTWNRLGNLFYDKSDFTSAISCYQRAIRYDASSTVYLKNLGLTYNQMADWNNSIDAYTNALKLTPDDTEALYKIGFAHFKLEHYAEARQWYQKGINVTDPVQNKNDLAYYRAIIGLAFQKEKNFQAAEKAFSEALRLNPNSADIQKYIGIIYYESQNFEKAIEYFKNVVKENEANAVFWEYFGLAYEGNKQFEEALSAYKKSISIEPKNSNYYFRLASLQLKLEDYEGSVEALKKGILQDPDNPEVLKMMKTIYQDMLLQDPDNPDLLKGLGEVEEKMFNYDVAFEIYKRALKINPDNEYFNNRAGICCFNLNDDENAIQYYLQAIAVNPNAAIYWENLGVSYYRLAQWQYAIEAYQHALDLEPTKERYNLLGVAYYNLGDQYKAIEHYKKAILLSDQEAVFYSNIALAYDKSDQKGEAENAYLKALEIAPENSSYHNNIGDFYYAMGDYKKAIEHYQKAIKFGKGEEVFFNNLGLAYEATGQQDQALKTYQQAVTLYPKNQLFNNKIVELNEDTYRSERKSE